MTDTTTDPHLGRVVAGYRIEELIGRGGMGLVYRAEHLNLSRRAAIKLIAPDLAEAAGFRERFNREARIAAALQHPNIVTVYDAGEEDGLLYLAMQHIQGSRPRAPSCAPRAGCARTARSTSAARSPPRSTPRTRQGLIHRDVKPANVLIEGRTAFLTDFGLTKRIDGTRTQLTRAGDVVGTIHYVAPEQIEGGRVDARSDIYSLGCLVYHVPLRRAAVRARHRRGRHLRAPVRGAAAAHLGPPDLPGGLDAVIAKALEKAPERRFQTCADLISAARSVIDAAGPLSDTATPRPVPAFGDALRRPDLHRRPPRPRGGRPQLASRPAIGPVAGARRGGAPPARPARRRRRQHARARRASPSGERIDVEDAAADQSLLESVRDGRPDLVILAWNAPGQPAREVVAALRGDAVTRDAKVLLLVDHKQADGGEVAAAGADDRLAAPFSPLQLQVKLRRLLGADAITG